MKTHPILSRIAKWPTLGTTPGNGRLCAHASGRVCAVDYGHMVRIFWKRGLKWSESPPEPHQYKKQVNVLTESK